MPDSAKFPLYDLRVFGNGVGKNPGRASAVQATRNAADPRVTLRWKPAQGAEFHIVRLGWRPDLMNQNFQVYHGATSLDANSLNLGRAIAQLSMPSMRMASCARRARAVTSCFD
jgi:xylan 1,4-beta-xylosidase